jgi:hypothetical protein
LPRPFARRGFFLAGLFRRGAAHSSLHREPVAQDALLFQPLDRRVQWQCGFYPGRGEQYGGTADTFDQARAAFAERYLPRCTEADFQAWRDHQTAEKYRRFDRGEPMPPNWRSLG